MSKTKRINKTPVLPEVSMPAKTAKDILALKEAQIEQLDRDEICNITEACIDLIQSSEAAGKHSTAEDLREKLDILCKYAPIVGGAEDIRRQDWEYNHSKILAAIHNHVNNKYSFPTVNTIASETKLSRQTVHKHLAEGMANKYYQERLKYWEHMTDSILKNLYKESIAGNVAASKVLLDNILRITQPAPTNIKQQNNYVQINSTKIDEVTIEALPASARAQIEQIIKQNTINL